MKSETIDRETMDTDVLIIGAGGAGARAAIAARDIGVRTLVVTKSRFGKGGATPTANAADLTIDGCSAADIGLPGDRRDSPEQFFRDIVADGLYLSNQRMVEAYVRENPVATRELLDWGMKVYSFEEAHSQTVRRGINTSAKEILRALGRGLDANKPDWLADHIVVDLLVSDNRIAGAVAVDQRSGTVRVIRCKAVVVATGGWQSGWFINSASAELAGDGQAMTYRAGGDLIDMEMVQAMPVCLLWPPSLRNSYLTYVLAECGVGKLLNANHERFMERYDPRMLERSTKEIVSIATALEVKAGRGTEHGGVYYTLDGTTEDELSEAVSAIAQYAEGSIQFRDGFPRLASEAFAGRTFEVGNLMHYMMGGIRVDETGAATIAGLFAAGECTGGLWGASRVSSALSEAVIHGRIAGYSAGRYAAGVSLAQLDEHQAAAAVRAAVAPLERRTGVRPLELKQRVQDIAARCIGVVKDGAGLASAIVELRGIEQEALPALATVSDSPRANLEWTEALELRNLVACLRISATSALHRTESRGSHYRLDAPSVDHDRWLCNIVLTRQGGIDRLTEEPVVVTSMALPKGRMTYEEANRVATASLSIAAAQPGTKSE